MWFDRVRRNDPATQRLRFTIGAARVGSYPRYRLLVTFFIEKKNWSFDQLLQTRMTEDEATENHACRREAMRATTQNLAPPSPEQNKRRTKSPDFPHIEAGISRFVLPIVAK
jgi:hypothetical protein